MPLSVREIVIEQWFEVVMHRLRPTITRHPDLETKDSPIQLHHHPRTHQGYGGSGNAPQIKLLRIQTKDYTGSNKPQYINI